MARYCESCGSPIDEDAAFCEICGARVEADEAAAVEVAEPVQVPPAEPEVIAVPEVTPEALVALLAEVADVAPPVQEREAVPAPEPEQAPIAEVLEAPTPIEPATPHIQTQPSYVELSPSVVPSQEVKHQAHSSLPKVAIPAVAILVLAGGVFGGMKLLKGKTANEPAKPDPEPAVQPTTPTPPVPTPSPTNTVDVSKLRTEVTKVLGDVSAAGWSDAVCSKELPKLKEQIAKAKEGGREDLGAYWTSLSFYVQACNSASKKDRDSSKKFLTSAVSELSRIPVEEIAKDSVLKGDVIGSIGSYMSIANDMGLPSSYPSCQLLVQLKNKLEKQ